MELIVLKRGCPEWEYMWEWLGLHPMNVVLEEPTVALNQDETWQYMGSIMKSNGEAIHNFRHRTHPITDSRMDLSLRSSDTIKEEDIEKRSKIK